jgi:tartrate dehydrogenase/decarboxylase / D-malate dehydrogenase
MNQYTIAAIPGDGIGAELVPGVIELLDHAAARRDVGVDWLVLDWNSSRYSATGEYMPDDWLQILCRTDAVFLGAVGDPTVPDHVSLWGLLLPIRRGLRQSINVRPIVSLPGILGPLRDEQPFDLVIVRENNEGEYTNVGGSLYEGSEDELVVQSSVFTRRGTERVMRYAFEHARSRRSDLVSATKSNGLVFSMPFWDKVARQVALDFPDVRFREMHIDALVARLVLSPSEFDVIVGSNLFGDILSDLGAALMGGIGLAASANINPLGDTPSMFEPVHGSAPDISGQGIANPTGQILSACLMFSQLGEPDVARDLEQALRRAVGHPDGRTPDVGGTATMLDALERIRKELDQGADAPKHQPRRLP